MKQLCPGLRHCLKSRQSISKKNFFFSWKKSELVKMGIRIKKQMGYSLSLKEVEELVCAPDISWIHGEFMEDGDKWEQMCDEILREHNSRAKDSWKSPFLMEQITIDEIKYDRRKRDFYRYINYDDEFGDKDTILFQPLLVPEDWSRYDDSIDYVEAHLDTTEIGPKVVRHNRALYPFINLMRKNPDSYLGIEEYWESCYLDNPEHKDAVPSCTYSVMLLLKYTGMVPEDKLADTIMLFRPTIYSYWC